MTQRYAHLRDHAMKRASDLASDMIDQATDEISQAGEKTTSSSHDGDDVR